MQILVPDGKCTCAFSDVVSPLFVEIKSKQTETETLAALRGTLLPKLLSGEFAVEKQPEEATA